jgi:hypothetical protein
MKPSSDHFIVGIFLAAFGLAVIALAYQADRDATKALETYARQQEELRIAKDKQVRDRLKMSTPYEILEAIQ